MFTVIYTKTLDNASNIIAESCRYKTIDPAISLFKDKVNSLLKQILDNEFLNSKISIYKHKALINIESTHHCIAIVEE